MPYVPVGIKETKKKKKKKATKNGQAANELKDGLLLNLQKWITIL